MASASVLVQPKSTLGDSMPKGPTEDPISRDQDLATIKDWLKKQPHLPDEWEESCLLSFLRGCSFSLEKCKKKLDMYFTMKNACPEFLADRDISRPELVELLKMGQYPTLPGLTPNGRRISICRAIDNNLDIHQLNDAIKVALMISDIRQREESPAVTGDVYILDASIVKPSHLGRLPLTAVKKLFICIQEAFPIRVKEIHIINASPLVDAFFNVIKPFLKEKMRQRVLFHKDYTGLYEYIPKDSLPKEYGGTNSSIDDASAAWLTKLNEYSGWFKKQETLKAREDLRPGKPKNYDQLFGIEGSFRQLSID